MRESSSASIVPVLAAGVILAIFGSTTSHNAERAQHAGSPAPAQVAAPHAPK